MSLQMSLVIKTRFDLPLYWLVHRDPDIMKQNNKTFDMKHESSGLIHG